MHQVIIPELPDFYHRYPDIHLQLNSSDDLTDLIEKGIDCVVRVGELDQQFNCRFTMGHCSDGELCQSAIFKDYGCSC